MTTGQPHLFPLMDQPTPAGRDDRCADVALSLPLHNPFTYLIPPAMAAEVQAGSRVLVPFGSRRLIGVVVEARARKATDPARLRAIAAVVESVPVLPAELLAFLRE